MNEIQAPPVVEMSGPALPPAAFAADAALFKTLSDPIRLAVLAALERGPLTVTGIRATIGPVAWSKLSYHLGQLQKAGLITGARRSNWIDYEITPFGVVVCGARNVVASLRPEVGVGAGVWVGGGDPEEIDVDPETANRILALLKEVK